MDPPAVARAKRQLTNALVAGPTQSFPAERQLDASSLPRFNAIHLDPSDIGPDPISSIPPPPTPPTVEQPGRFAQQIRRLSANMPSANKGKCSSSMPLPPGMITDDLLQHDAWHSRPPRPWHSSDDSVQRALDAATVDGNSGRNSTGVRAWIAFCADVIGTSPERPMDPNAPLWCRLEEEWLAMRFICTLVQQRGIRPDTARGYFSQVQGWHLREYGVKLGGGIKMDRLPQMIKGLRRTTPEAPRPIRRGVSPQQLSQAFDKCLDPSNPAHANQRAALAVALQGLLRSAEYCGKRDRFTLLRSDINKLDAKTLILMMHPCKNMTYIGSKDCPLVIGAGGKYIDAVKEVHNLRRVDPAPDDAPLFRDPATNQPLSYDSVLQLLRRLMSSIGEEPAHFGTHSLRIGGATALFAAGASDTVIRTLGRWSSDIHKIYVRACYGACTEWTRRAGSTSVAEVAADFVEVDDY